MKFLTELLQSSTMQYLTEDVGGSKKHYFQGLFLEFDSPNKNKRIYRSSFHDPVVETYIADRVRGNRAYGELDHPDGPVINLKNVCHIVKEMHKEGPNWHGKAEITNTPYGSIVKGLFESEAALGVSSRGLGSLKQIKESGKDIFEVQPDYKLVTVNDVVSDPSAHGAFVRGIMENVEWFYDDNLGWIAEDLKTKVKKMSKSQIEEQKTLMFENFLRKLSNQ